MRFATARTFVRVAAALALVASALAGRLVAQGVTTGAVRGRVLDQAGQPVVGASVQLVNQASGSRFLSSSNADGLFYVANVIVGTYTIEARAIGHRPLRRPDIAVALGQVASVELRLEVAAVELAPLAVTAEAENALLSRGRTGATASVSEELVRNLPSLQHNFGDFVRTTPLVNGRSVAGQADRFNSIQIDGGTNADLFGLNASGGSPGGRNDSRPLSIEAVKEFQVLIAPFDVRQGGFTGGLINAVTQSGTNEFHGSVFGYMQSEALVGNDTLGNPPAAFDRKFYGFSLGGPILRDRLHFFVSAEWRDEDQEFSGTRNISPGDTVGGASCATNQPTVSCWNSNAGISATTAERVRQYSINSLGFDPGDWAKPTIPNPDRNLFMKLSGQLGQRTQFEITYANTQSELAVLTHDPFGANPTRLREGYQYDASGYGNTNDNNSLRARLNSQLGDRITNEFLVNTYHTYDERAMPNRVSLMIVGADSAGAHLALGGERFSQANTLDQKVLEISDNITYTLSNHVFTLGGRFEQFDFRNVFFPASLGAWYFPDTTSFFAGTPTRYERAIPGIYGDSVNGRADGPIADFNFRQVAAYLQDQWTVARGFTLSLGLRADWTSMPAPSYNPLLDTVTVVQGPNAGSPFAVRTDNKPTDELLISPRVGFNYDVRGDQSFLIRGGAGVFSGRTPYVWASNAYTNTGLEQLQLTCTGAAVPAFQIDPDSQYTACATGGALTLPRPAIVYFDQDFKLPQRFSMSLGMDRRLPWDMVGTVDLLYNQAINQFLLEDVNLVEGGRAVGEGGRYLYGTLSSTSSSSTPRRATTAANDVLRQYNSNKDYSYTLSFQLTKNMGSRLTLQAGYAYSRSYDLMSPGSDISNSLLNFATLDGRMSDRNLRPSLYDQPHSVRLAGTANLGRGFQFSLYYTGSSGRPFTYRYNNDVNGDGFSGNDPFYVPLNSQDILMSNPSQYAALDAYIEGEKCLREQRGRIMERNSCRNPWQGFVDARLAKSFRTIRNQRIELMANMFNVLSFLGVGGTVRQTTGFENVAILSRTGYNSASGRGIYSLLLPTKNQVQYPASRWKLEFGARYAF
jgi:hypothetical protein